MPSSSSSKCRIFTCDQHATNISKKMLTFYQDQLLFDIALRAKTDNLKVHAHRTVLSASSDYFLAMLCSTLKEAKSDVIELEIDGPTLKLLVDFMYTGKIELRCENVSRLLAAAEVLKMSTLKAACSDFIGDSIDISNWLSTALMAKQQNSTELHEMAFRFALQNFNEVRMNDEFLQLTEEQLSKLISSDDLSVKSEETVFHSLVSWIEYDRGSREKYLTNLLPHVRYSLLKPEFILENRHSVCKSMELFDLICSWTESHMSRPKLSIQHSDRKWTNEKQEETLGFLSGVNTDNLKFQTYDPESNTWSSENLPPPPTARSCYRAAVMGMKLIFAKGLLSGYDNVVQCLDLQTKEWTSLPPMRKERQAPGMVEFHGDLYIVGGIVNGNWSGSVEKYDSRSREWQELMPMHSAPDFVQAIVLDELLYAVGNASAIESFCPATNKWTQISDKQEKSTCFSISAVGRHLYAVGGMYNGHASKTVERYDPLTKTWTVISPGLQLGLHDLKCVSWNSRLVACRGFDSQCKLYNLVECYSPETNEWKTLAPVLAHDLGYCSLSLFTFRK